MLVDEDTSAGNFMARDGRMRALIKEEAITPLLYRVSGLWEEEGVSTVCVVGGNGDWLGESYGGRRWGRGGERER